MGITANASLRLGLLEEVLVPKEHCVFGLELVLVKGFGEIVRGFSREDVFVPFLHPVLWKVFSDVRASQKLGVIA